MKRFIEGEDRRQIALLPESLEDYVGEDNPARVVEAFVEARTTRLKEKIATLKGQMEKLKRLQSQIEQPPSGQISTRKTSSSIPSPVNTTVQPAAD